MVVPYQFQAQTVIDEGRTSRGAVDEIKEWVVSSSLPALQEEMIVLFLLSCDNAMKATQDTIRAYFRIKSRAPEMFTRRDVDDDSVKRASRVTYCISLPERMDHNTVIHYFKINDPNYQNLDLVQSMKLAYMIVDVSQRYNPPDHLVVILDMKGVNLMHVTRLKINALKKFFEYLQEAMPLKIKLIHILNTNYLFDKIIGLCRMFIKSELMNIIKTHPPGMDMTAFHRDCVPASCLPREYGGALPTCEELNEKCVQQLRELRAFFEAEEELMSAYKN